MPPSPIRKLVPYAEAAKKRGTQVIHLNIGQPDIATPQVALDAIRGLDRTVIEYSYSAGYESYRKGLAAYYAGHGIAVTHEQIIVTNGGSEALLFAMMACFEPGDEVISVAAKWPITAPRWARCRPNNDIRFTTARVSAGTTSM